MTVRTRTNGVLALVGEGAAALEDAATAAGTSVTTVASVQELLVRLGEGHWTATIVSLDADHLDDRIVERVGRESGTGALVLTAPAVSMQRALLMERVGAVALLREPIDAEELSGALRNAMDEGRSVALPTLAEPVDESFGPTLVGESDAMAEVFRTVARVARSNATVLLTGESGTGKEVVARALHWASDRRGEPFVAINCAAIPEHLLESELFGHEKGAFTGAVARRVGRFERAGGGTLFLDEIGDMSLVLQAKILRALEERLIERVGGESTIPVDVRVVAATNQELSGAMAAGRFREDLYYRLAVVQLRMPPLRERGSDLHSLALHFAAHFARRYEKPVLAITERALRRLEQGRWPGNVRELRNVMDRAVLLSRGPTIRAADLRIGAGAPVGSAHAGQGQPGGYAPTMSIAEVESDHIRRVLESVDCQLGRAAAVLGIHRNTLARKVREYGIDATAQGGAAG